MTLTRGAAARNIFELISSTIFKLIRSRDLLTQADRFEVAENLKGRRRCARPRPPDDAIAVISTAATSPGACRQARQGRSAVVQSCSVAMTRVEILLVSLMGLVVLFSLASLAALVAHLAAGWLA